MNVFAGYEQACPNFEHVERERASQMPQQVCDVSSLASQLVWTANQHRLGFVSSFLSYPLRMNVLVKATNRPVRISNTLERERASQMAQQVCDVSKSASQLV
jgi:hypothetical protein